MESFTTEEGACAAEVSSDPSDLASRAVVDECPTIQTPMFVAPTDSAPRASAHLPVAADLMSIHPPPTAAVTAGSTIVISTSAAVAF